MPASLPLTSLLAGGALLALICGFVLVSQVAYADRVYPGVRALGLDLGGYSREDARRALENALNVLAQQQVTLRYGDQSWTVTARELGLQDDVSSMLQAVMAIGREGNVLERFWTQIGLAGSGGDYREANAAFDEAAQRAVLRRIAAEVDRPVREAELIVRPDHRVELREAQSGRKLDVEASLARLRSVLGHAPAEPVELVVQETPAQSDNAQLARARDEAAQILSSPLTLKLGDRRWTLDQAQLAAMLRFDQRPGAEPAASLDRSAVLGWVKQLADEVNQAPQDARFAWAGGRLDVIRPSRDGIELDEAATTDAVLAAAASATREVPLVVKVTRPAVPMEARYDLGIKELIETARTSFAGSVAAKRHNITLAAQRLNGVVVPPGGMFSFNKELGPTTLDAGFQIGWGITTSGSNVKTVPSVAGGICQVATTLFHAVFWSGYQIEERNWHLYWIPAYTSKGVVGLDATVDEEAGLDFKFINPTKDYLLIQSWVDDASNINFALYGTKPSWTVKVEPSVMTDVVPADTSSVVIEEEPSMPEGARLQVERATDGFVVTNVRHVIQGDDERVLRLVSRYRPSRNVVLVGTGGKPAGAQTVVETNKPAGVDEKKPTGDNPKESQQQGGAPSATATPKPTAAPTVTRPAPTPTPVKKR